MNGTNFLTFEAFIAICSNINSPGVINLGRIQRNNCLKVVQPFDMHNIVLIASNGTVVIWSNRYYEKD